MERDLAESRAHLAEISAVNDALRRANADLEASRIALVQSEARLRLALEAARMATWEWSHVGNAASGSSNREAIYGAEPGSLRTLDDVLAIVHPDDRPQAARTVDRAFSRPAHEAEFDAVEFRVVDRDGGVRWLRSQGRVVAWDPRTGEPRHATGVTFDITDRRAAEQAASRALAEIRAVYDTVPAGLALLDAEGRFISLNARLAEIFGAPGARPGDALEGALPAEAAAPLRAAHRRAVAEALAVTAAEIRFDAPAASGDRRVLLASLQPIRSGPEEGGVSAVSLLVEDVTERRRAEAKRDLLAREVDHRARNALAVVLAAVRMTRADDVPAFARAVEGRIAAVARAQTLLADRHWSGAALRTLVEGSLAVFVPDSAAGRVRLDGPDLTLDAVAVQPFCMAMHELATNATKHGAFSRADGSVAISWSVDGPAGALRLRWSETRGGGPSLSGAPPRAGFGSRVIRATIRDQLGGKVEQHWKGTGLVCDITLPLARVAAAPSKRPNGDGRGGGKAAGRRRRPSLPAQDAGAADAV